MCTKLGRQKGLALVKAIFNCVKGVGSSEDSHKTDILKNKLRTEGDYLFLDWLFLLRQYEFNMARRGHIGCNIEIAAQLDIDKIIYIYM